MNKVYIYHQKISKILAVMAISFGVVSCSTSQSTVASSGETDGVYYSPSKDGKVVYVSNEGNAQSSEIKVGGAYFDAEGNGAEEFYYEQNQNQDSKNNVYIYTGANNVYATSGTTGDWGRYDGVDITINNWGWSNPWWGYYDYWGWPGMYWGYSGWRAWYNPYWGWGSGWWGYSFGWGGYYGPHHYYPYYYSPYYHPHYYHGGYYGSYYSPYRYSPARPGVRPGSNLAFSPRNDVRMSGVRGNSLAGTNSGVRPVRGNQNALSPVRSDQGQAIRPVRADQPIRSNQNINSNETPNRPVRATNNNEVRSDGNSTPTRPVRQAPVRDTRQVGGETPNRPVRNNEGQVRGNDTKPNRTVTPQREVQPNRGNQGIQGSPSRNSGNTGGIRGNSGSTRGSSSSAGGGRVGGGRR